MRSTGRIGMVEIKLKEWLLNSNGDSDNECTAIFDSNEAHKENSDADAQLNPPIMRKTLPRIVIIIHLSLSPSSSTTLLLLLPHISPTFRACGLRRKVSLPAPSPTFLEWDRTVHLAASCEHSSSVFLPNGLVLPFLTWELEQPPPLDRYRCLDSTGWLAQSLVVPVSDTREISSRILTRAGAG